MQNSKAAALRRAVLLFGVATLVVGCSRDGGADEHLAHVDTLLAQRNYPQAIQESRQVLEAHRDDRRAIYLLGRAHLELSELTQAYHYLLKARDLEPDDVNARLDLATIYLIESKPEEARVQAEAALRLDSTNAAAVILHGSSARTAAQVDDAIKKLEATPSSAPGATRRRIALGVLYLRKRDTATAGKLLREAVVADGKSAEAHAALASLYSLQHSPAAEPEQRAADGLAPSAGQRLEMAKSYLLLGQRSEAKRILTDILARSPKHLPARRLLAEVQLVDGDQSALQTLAPILLEDSSDVEALVQRGRWRLATRDLVGAAGDFERALRTSRDLAPAHFGLAMANVERARDAKQKPQLDSAIAMVRSELEKTLKLTRNYPEAVYQLAELNIRTGESRSAVKDIEQFLTDNPGSLRAYELLAATLSAIGRSDESIETFQRLIKAAPDRPQSHYELGVALLGQGKKTEATQEFEAALTLAPGYADPMTQIVLTDLTSERLGSALARVNEQLRRVPQSAPLYDLLGLIYAARNQQDSAEIAYRRAVELDPNLADARVRLAELYEGSGRPALALPHAESARKLEPMNPRALMATAVAYQQMNDVPRARAAYEATLALNPRFPGAANNLAYLLSEQPGQEENAFKLASMARQSAPDDPHVADTFGWILYKRGDYQRALTMLKQSAAKLPESPSVQYHLGMTAQKLGDTTMARAALTKAVGASNDFAGKEEARKALTQLKE